MKAILITIILSVIQISLVFGQCTVCDQNPYVAGASIIGLNSTATGVGSIAIGTNSHTTDNAANSIAIGTAVKTVASLSMVIGSGRDSENMLVNNLQQSLMIGFGSSQPTFFVSRSNAYNKTGRIGIGNVTSPQAKLHIRSDNLEKAAFFIEPNSWNTGEEAKIMIGDTNHFIRTNKNIGIEFNSLNNFVFNGLNTGFGIEEPKAKIHISGDLLFENSLNGIIMKSEDGNCWKGTISNIGDLVFVQVDCETLSSTNNITEPKHSEVFIYPNPTHGQISVEYTGNRKNIRLEAKTIAGHLIGTYKINKGENKIELNNISDQMIIVSVFTTKGELISTNKVVINK
jgi:hypothetical protein